MQKELDSELKTALLSGDRAKVEVIKSLKNALQYEAVKLRASIADLTDSQMADVLSRESKKRQEAAEIYKKSGEEQRANTELAEKVIIDRYLPEKLNDEQISEVVKEEISKLEDPSPKDLGIVIHAVKQRLQTTAEGSTIARITKEYLETK
jgi:uncharacterized protein YqeY